MSEKREFKGVWIPREVWLSKELTLLEKVMFVEIDSLHNDERGCYASNAHFAEFFGLSKSRVSEVISSLAAKGLVEVTQVREGRQIVERQLRVTRKPSEAPPSEKAKNPIRKRRRTLFGKGDEPCSEKAQNPVGKGAEPPSEKAKGSNTPLSNTGINPVKGIAPPLSGDGGAQVVPVAKPPMVIQAGGKRHEIPAELKYPGPEAKTHRTWINYAICYQKRYGAWPVWNATVGGKVAQFIKRVGEDAAPKVAAFYVGLNELGVTKAGHGVGKMLADAEKYHTQWMTGRALTDTRARQIDQSQSNFDASDEALEILAQRRARNAHA